MVSTSENNIELGKRIKVSVDNSGNSQAEFASLMGVYPSNLSRWIKGECAPTYEYLVKIARCGKVSLDWLLTGEGTMSEAVSVSRDDGFTYPAGTVKPTHKVSEPPLSGYGVTNPELEQLINQLYRIYHQGDEVAKAKLRTLLAALDPGEV